MKDAEYHIRKAKAREKELAERRQAVLTVGVIVAVFVTALLLAGAGSTERDYSEACVTVRSGDTLWGIAEDHCPADMDIRKYINYIKTDNDCSSEIHSGDTLTVRIYDEK